MKPSLPLALALPLFALQAAVPAQTQATQDEAPGETWRGARMA